METDTGSAPFLQTYWQALLDLLGDYPEVAALGAAIGLVAVIASLFFVLKGMVRISRRAHQAGVIAEVRRGSDVGARILIARGSGGKGREISRFLSHSTQTHLKRFMFGGPFDIIEFPVRVKNLTQARRILEETNADLMVWGDSRSSRMPIAHIIRRHDMSDRGIKEQFIYNMPAKAQVWSSALAMGLSYGAARALRPALGRPADFRSDRLAPVVETLEHILGENPVMDDALTADILDDYASGALQLALSDVEGWQDRSVDIMRDTLARLDRAKAPERWVTAKINLGRALKLRCERKFDPILLQEAINHLTDALESLRMEPRFKIAEGAAQAIADCQKMLGTRRRFSITQGGI